MAQELIMVASADKSLALTEVARQTRLRAGQLAILGEKERNQALEVIANALEQSAPEILAANQQDLAIAEQAGIAPALYARLKLGESKLQSAIAGIRDVVQLSDPIGAIQIKRELDKDLILQRVTCPLGVLGIIFEARPEALIQITSLAIK